MSGTFFRLEARAESRFESECIAWCAVSQRRKKSG
jgi:hypothetical protein